MLGHRDARARSVEIVQGVDSVPKPLTIRDGWGSSRYVELCRDLWRCLGRGISVGI